MPDQRLEHSDRDFFALVSRATFINPFSEERDLLDRRIAQAEGDDPDLIERLVARVEARLEQLEGRGQLRAEDYPADEWDIIQHAIAFETFHRFVEPLDRLIETQLDAGARSVRVPFADEVLRRLASRGVAQETSLRMLALIWQMRRAYYFLTDGLTGISPSMRRLREAVWNDVFTNDFGRYERMLWDRLEDFSVILRGETGSGKGQAAAAIGRSGYVPFDPRAGAFETSFTELFVPLNLSQFPESLIESELFGHKKGAFTGAVDSHAGAFSRCSPHGAIFLDEIGEVSIPVQIKLLRVLQDRVFTPVGSHEERRFEGRVIAATHRDLDVARRDKRFRDDFYYRLCSDVIEVPTLRVRLAEEPRELELLVERLLARIVGRVDEALLERTAAVIREGIPEGYDWPGNVRELEQCVRRVLMTGRCGPDVERGGGTLARGHDTSPTGRFLAEVREGALEARELTARYCALLYAKHGTYEEVARITGLDRRTVRKYVVQVGEDEGADDDD